MASLLSAKEAAAILAISVQAVHRLADRATLGYVRVCGRRLFRRDVLDQYLANPELQARRRASSPIRRGDLSLSLGEVPEDAATLRRVSPKVRR